MPFLSVHSSHDRARRRSKDCHAGDGGAHEHATTHAHAHAHALIRTHSTRAHTRARATHARMQTKLTTERHAPPPLPPPLAGSRSEACSVRVYRLVYHPHTLHEGPNPPPPSGFSARGKPIIASPAHHARPPCASWPPRLHPSRPPTRGRTYVAYTRYALTHEYMR